MYTMYGMAGVTHVLLDEQNSAPSAFFSEKSNFLDEPFCFSMEKLNFGFLDLWPINDAIILLRLLSLSSPSKIFSCLANDIKFLEIFTIIGIADNNTELIKVANGVTNPDESEISGDNPA